MWKLDFGLISDGRHHFTVNHFTNFVDPITSAHTDKIQSSWRAELPKGHLKQQ